MIGIGAVHARRPGLRDADPDAAAAVALRRGRRDPRRASTRASPPATRRIPSTLCGPVISAKQRDRIVGYIQKGIDEGATLLVGGAEAPDGLDKGFFVKPTLFVDVDNSMTIAQEEIFGPVLVVIPYDDDDDAVRIANDSPYGLAGNVHVGVARTIARPSRAGCAPASSGSTAARRYGADVPFGGYKASGVGRQNGIAGFDQYLEVKSVAYPARLGVRGR